MQALNAELFPYGLWFQNRRGHSFTVIWICILGSLLAGIPLEWLVSTVLPTFIKQYRWQYLCLLSGLWNEYESGSVATSFTHFTVPLWSPALRFCSLRAFHGIPVLDSPVWCLDKMSGNWLAAFLMSFNSLVYIWAQVDLDLTRWRCSALGLPLWFEASKIMTKFFSWEISG